VTRGRVRVRSTPATAHEGDGPIEVGPEEALLTPLDEHHFRLQEADRIDPVDARIARRHAGPPAVYEVLVDGWRFELEVEDASRAELRERAGRGGTAGRHDGPVEVRAMIPGRVMSIEVEAGHAVVLGQPLVVVEAMKMQNETRAPRAGVVERIAVAVGQTIEPGDLVVVLA
jgi:biotin carboxyl carrier protein